MASSEDLIELKQREDIVQTWALGIAKPGPMVAKIVGYNTIHGQRYKLAGHFILPRPL